LNLFALGLRNGIFGSRRWIPFFSFCPFSLLGLSLLTFPLLFAFELSARFKVVSCFERPTKTSVFFFFSQYSSLNAVCRGIRQTFFLLHWDSFFNFTKRLPEILFLRPSSPPFLCFLTPRACDLFRPFAWSSFFYFEAPIFFSPLMASRKRSFGFTASGLSPFCDGSLDLGRSFSRGIVLLLFWLGSRLFPPLNFPLRPPPACCKSDLLVTYVSPPPWAFHSGALLCSWVFLRAVLLSPHSVTFLFFFFPPLRGGAITCYV